jgi:hypothetical protein
MLRPTPGELLHGVRRELREQVLPHVPDGAPARQLRAALHVLGRLERSWDLLPAYLEADNADLDRTLRAVTDRLGTSRADRPSAGTPDVPGVQDQTLRDLIAQNACLQGELERVQRSLRRGTDTDLAIQTELHALHVRMAGRAARAAAVAEGD